MSTLSATYNLLSKEEVIQRLEEAEETLRAIQSGEVDALVISGAKGDQVFTLKDATLPYQILIEEMNEGALTLSSQGMILYCNPRFAEMLALPIQNILGESFLHFVVPGDQTRVKGLLEYRSEGKSRGELTLTGGQTEIPVGISLKEIMLDGMLRLGVVITDLTERRQADEELRRYHEQLEERVNERTQELKGANELLHASRRIALDLMQEAIDAKEMLEEVNFRLRDSEHKFSLIFDKAPFAASLSRWPDSVLVDVNEAWVKAFGYGRQEAIGKTALDLNMYPDVAARTPVLTQLHEQRFIRNREELLCTKSGELRVFSLNIHLVNISGQDYVLNAALDITERKRTEAIIQQKELELREAQRIAHIGSWNWDARTDITTGSDELLRIYGFDPTLQSMPDFKQQRGVCYPVDEWEYLNVAVQRTMETGIGYELDVRAIRDGKDIWITTRGEVVRDAEGRAIGLRGTVQDITERKQTETAIIMANREVEKNQAILEAVVQQMPVGIILTDAAGTVAKNNAAMDRIWRRKMLPTENIESHEYIAYHQDGREYLPEEWPLSRALLNGEEIFGEEMTILRGDGTKGSVYVSSASIKDKNGQIIAGVVVDMDITERKLAEAALVKSEERYRSLFNGMTEGFALHEIICDESGRPCDYRFFEINPAFEHLTGLTREQVVGRLVSEVLPASEPFWIETYGQVALTGQPVHFENYSAALNRYYEVFAYSPARYQFAVLFIDVSERRQAEALLQERNQELEAARTAAENERRRLEAVMEALPVGVAITDTKGGSLKANNAYDLIWGEDRPPVDSVDDYASFQAWWAETGKIVEPEDWASAQVVQKGVSVVGQLMEIQRFDGSHAFILNGASPVHDADGRIVGAAVAVQDITALRVAEQALRKANDELELRVKKRTEELAAKNKRLLNEIKERAEIEKQLIIQSTAMGAAANGILISNPQGNILWVNPALTQMSGYSHSELLGQNTRIFNSGRQDETFYHGMWATILSGGVWRGELINQRKDGSHYIEGQTITPVFDVNKQITHFISIKQDITEHKRAEQDLQELSKLEHNQRLFLDALVEAALILNKSLNLDEVLTRILEQIDTVIPYHFANITLLEGESFYVASYRGREIPSVGNNRALIEDAPILAKMRQSGQPVLIWDTRLEPEWVNVMGLEWCNSFLAAPLLVEQQVIGFMNLYAEQSGYFSQEMCNRLVAFAAHATVAIQNAWLFEQVRSSSERLHSLSRRLVDIQENERHYIARELHDEAGQMLTSLVVDLGMLEKKADQPELVLKKVAEMDRSLNEIIENLHRMAVALRPATLDHLGLVAALRQQVEMMGEKHSLKVSFKSVEELRRLPDNVETVLYRIVQEALTNVARHAQASQVDVVLTVRGDKLVLIVEDDGIGFNPDTVLSDGHLGLFGMRERAEMIEGLLVIESAPGKGTTVMVEVGYEHTINDR